MPWSAIDNPSVVKYQPGRKKGASAWPWGGRAITRRIAVINEKGGSCKTTLTSSVGDYLARVHNKRVLLVDLDPQGQLGKVLGIDVGAVRRTALDLLLDAVIGEETRPALPAIRARHPNLDLVPSNKSLALFPAEAAGLEHDTRVLRNMERKVLRNMLRN